MGTRSSKSSRNSGKGAALGVAPAPVLPVVITIDLSRASEPNYLIGKIVRYRNGAELGAVTDFMPPNTVYVREKSGSITMQSLDSLDVLNKEYVASGIH